MMRVLAVGPGPTSVEIDAEDLGAVLVQIELNRSQWIDGQANALDVFAGAPESDVDAALERAGWSVRPATRSLDGAWTVHERCRWPDEVDA